MLELNLQEGDQAYQSGDLERALEIYEPAAGLFPGNFRVKYNYGVLLRDLDRHHDALREFEIAARLQPTNPDVFNNLGIIHESLLQYGQAAAHYRAAISLSPELAQAHFNLGMLMLRLGHYEEGFAQSEWRWDTDQFSRFECPHPKWDGSYLRGTVLIHTEQGAGDAIQFIRYLPLAAEHCDRVMLVCPQRLMPLFSNVPGVDELRTAGEFSVESFQAYTPLLSLPYLAVTTVDTIPPPASFLTPSKNPVPLPEFGPADPKLKVGISWAGSRTHTNDHNRSSALHHFAPLFDLPGVTFYSLQVDESRDELEAFPDQICDLSGLQGDWSEAASLVQQLDLVIAVDTGVAHLAASLGVPTWIALSQKCDWRWMIDREDSPWYPSVRLFRQPSPGDWDAIVSHMREALSLQLSNP